MVEQQTAGHRQRLRERFLAGDAGAGSDLALLELLLSYAIPRVDVQPLARELLDTFGGLAQILTRSPEELARVRGLGQAAVVLLRLVHRIAAACSAATVCSLPSASSRAGEGKSMAGGFANAPSPLAGESRSRGTERLPRAQPAGRKLQVSNGYLLEFDQLARVLRVLFEQGNARKVARKVLQDATGLADRHVASLVSMGAALGLIEAGRQILSPIGRLFAAHDPFMEKKTSLEWCHYAGAGSARNLVWFEIFNRLLPEPDHSTETDWCQRLRRELAGQFSERTMKTSLRAEVHFVVDAYLERNLRRLELLRRTPDGRLYPRRYVDFNPLVLGAMLYDFGAAVDSRLLQVGDLVVAPGSPALLFGLDAATVRQQIEGLHERGWLRYETTHNLDQIRLKTGFSAVELLAAHFEQREPREGADRAMRGLFE
jgi:hypothetical protein